jgi:cytochrome c-type biogenesis protein CcmH/NrfG
MSMTDLARAIEALETTLAHDPGNPAGLQELAGLGLSNGDIEGAIAAYSRCITFAPQNAAARKNLPPPAIGASVYAEVAAALALKSAQR